MLYIKDLSNQRLMRTFSFGSTMEADMPIERETIVQRAPSETVVVGGGISPFGIIGGSSRS